MTDRIPKNIQDTPLCILKRKLAWLCWELRFIWGRIKYLPIRLRRAAAYAAHGFYSEDFDFAYLLRDVRFKLLRMAAEHRSTDYIEDQTPADQMESLAELLELLTEDRWFIEREWAILRAKHLAKGPLPDPIDARTGKAKESPEWAKDKQALYALSDEREEEVRRAATKLFLKCYRNWWT